MENTAIINGKEVAYDFCSEFEDALDSMGISEKRVEFLGKGKIYKSGGTIMPDQEKEILFWKLR